MGIALHACGVAGLHQALMVPEFVYKQTSYDEVASRGAGHGSNLALAKHPGGGLPGAHNKPALLEHEEVVSVADSFAAETRGMPLDHRRAAYIPPKDDPSFSVADSVAFRPPGASFAHVGSDLQEDGLNIGLRSPNPEQWNGTHEQLLQSQNQTVMDNATKRDAVKNAVQRTLQARVRAVVNEMGNVEEAQKEHREELAEVKDIADAATDLIVANTSYQHAASKMPHLLSHLKKHNQTLSNVSATMEAAETLGLKASSDLKGALQAEDDLQKRYHQLAQALEGYSFRTTPIVAMVMMKVFFATCD